MIASVFLGAGPALAWQSSQAVSLCEGLTAAIVRAVEAAEPEDPADPRIERPFAFAAPPPFEACPEAVTGFPDCAIEQSPLGSAWTLSRSAAPSQLSAEAQRIAREVRACFDDAPLSESEPPWPEAPQTAARLGYLTADSAVRVVVDGLQRPGGAGVVRLVVVARQETQEAPRGLQAVDDAALIIP